MAGERGRSPELLNSLWICLASARLDERSETLQEANSWKWTSLVLSQHVPGTLLSNTRSRGVHFARPKIHIRFMDMLIWKES